MLGEHGYPGLFLFLGLIGSCYLSLYQLRRRAKLCPVLDWIPAYTFMLEGSILAFMVSGAFLEFANFDLWYLIIGIIAAMKIFSAKEYRGWLFELARPNPSAGEQGVTAAHVLA